MGKTDNIPSLPLLILLHTHTHLLPPTPHCDLTSPPPSPPHPSLIACTYHFTSMYLLPPPFLFPFSHPSPPHSLQTLFPFTHNPLLSPNFLLPLAESCPPPPPTSLAPSSTPSLHAQQNVPNQSSPRCPECHAQQQHTVAQELSPQWHCWP